MSTPPKVNPNVFNQPSLKLIGRAIPAKFTPLTTGDVFEILKLKFGIISYVKLFIPLFSPLYQNLIAGFADLFRESEAEMNALCLDHNWLIDIRTEYLEWSKINMPMEWVDQSPYVFEVNEILIGYK